MDDEKTSYLNMEDRQADPSEHESSSSPPVADEGSSDPAQEPEVNDSEMAD